MTAKNRCERFFCWTQNLIALISTRRTENHMPGVKVHDGESVDRALKAFKKQCEKSGILTEIRKREYFEKPSVKRKKKILAARKKRIRSMSR